MKGSWPHVTKVYEIIQTSCTMQFGSDSFVSGCYTRVAQSGLITNAARLGRAREWGRLVPLLYYRVCSMY